MTTRKKRVNEIRTEQELLVLGTRIAAIHAAADKEFLEGWLVGLSSREQWAAQVNSRMASFPKLILLKKEAESAFLRYAEGCDRIDAIHRPVESGMTFMGGMLFGQWIQAGSAMWRLLQHGGARGDFDALTPINEACSRIVKNYALLSIDPKGHGLVRGEWWVWDYIRNSALKCPAGLHLEGRIRILSKSEVEFLNDIRWD